MHDDARSTRPSVGTPHRLLRAAVVPWLLAAAGVGAVAPTIQVRPDQPRPGDTVLVSLHGEWAEACPPGAATAVRDGLDLTIRLSGGGECEGPVQPAEVPVTPSGDGVLRWGGAGAYRLRLLGHERPGAPERLLAFRLLEVASERRPAVPEPGLWWHEPGAEFDRAGPGLGVSLERQGSLLSATVFGYDGDGRSQWFYGAAPLDGRVARIELSALAGGRGPFADYRAPDAIAATGVLHLQFIGPARAVAWFEGGHADGGRSLQTISLVRFRAGDDPATAFLGDWLLFADEPWRGREARARWVRLDEVARREGGFRLTGPGEESLECDLDVARPNSPPVNCRLRTEGSYIDFQVTGLDRLRGHSPDGSRLSLIRQPRD